MLEQQLRPFRLYMVLGREHDISSLASVVHAISVKLSKFVQLALIDNRTLMYTRG